MKECINLFVFYVCSIDSLQPLVNLKFLESVRLDDKLKNTSNPGMTT